MWLWMLALLCFLVSVALAFGAMVFLIVDCNEDSHSVCSTGGYGQFAIALAGVALSLAAMLAGAIGRRPGAWLCAAVLAFASWFVVVFTIGETA